jgi:glycine hydroxymethyltransferase
VAAKLHPDPVPHADFVTSTTHKTLRGPRSGFAMCKSEWQQKLDSAVFPGTQGGPLMHVVAAKAVAFGEALRPEFTTYIRQVIANAKRLAEELARQGCPIVSGGTDNHLLLVDVFTKYGIGGKIAEAALDAAGITVNKNMIPYDARKPLDPSGIRIGSPALTTRGMKEAEMTKIAAWIHDVLSHPGDADKLAKVKHGVEELCEHFPAPSEAAA